MTGKYQYIVHIAIDGASSQNELYRGTAEYAGSAGRTDQVIIHVDHIKLECQRASLIELGGIFSNYQSGLYGQIAKCITFYICITQTIPVIKAITINAVRNSKVSRHLTIGSADLKQPASLQGRFPTAFDAAALQVLFEESAKSSALLKTISHLIRAKTKQDPFDRFDSLWKSYNALYRLVAGKTKDHDCHVVLRQFLLQHPAASQSVAARLKTLDATALREKLRWRALILNDFESAAKAKAFSDFIRRYTDARLMKVFEGILPYRAAFLKSAGLLKATEDHIALHLKTGTVNDQEIAALVCIKYMYFVRNKSAHGERLDRIIGLGNQEVTEIKWLGGLLETLIVDLVNANPLY